MKNVTNSFVFLGQWPFARIFEFNTDILATNLINIFIVIGLLFFFGKGVLNDLLDNREQKILNTLQNSEKLRKGAVELLDEARVHLQKVELEANEYRMNEYSDIEQEKQDLMKDAYKKLEQYKNNKNEIFYFEQERAMNQVQQRICQQALERALATIKNRLNTELHFRIIRVNISLLRARAMKWKKK